MGDNLVVKVHYALGSSSPLLANIYRNEYDQEMEHRGVKAIRYADDIVVFAKSKRAAQHLLESSQKLLEGKLKLTMNTQKSKVVNLKKLGIPAQKAYQWGNSRLGYWRIAGTCAAPRHYKRKARTSRVF